MVSVQVLVSKVLTMDLDIMTYISYYFLFIAVAMVILYIIDMTAPYGRYVRPGFGVQLKANITWFIQEFPAYAVPLSLVMFGDPPRLNGVPNRLFVGLYLLHYVHRGLIYPYLMKAGKSMSLAVFLVAILFCALNGYMQCGYLLYHAEFPADWLSRPQTYAGIVIFLVGMAINVHSDHLLRTLRKPGEGSTYKIPTGGMFNFISGANFFGEIVEWSGFALATWSFPAACFAISTASNLGIRALQHHSYYLKKFDNYPKDRKALIPFIW